jgi:GMC oxidoreductase
VFVTDATLLTASQRAPDVLVVGAGAVGIVLSLALARSGIRVLLLEAGPYQPDSNFRHRNVGPSTGRPYRGLLDGRMKALGGTTRLWGGQLASFSRADFARRFDHQASNEASGVAPICLAGNGWPIDYDELAPYITRAATFVGLPCPDELLAGPGAAEPLCLDNGTDLEISRHIWLQIPDFVSLFGRDLAGCDHLWIATNAELRELHFVGDRVSVAVARTVFGATEILTPRQVVLANGTLELVRILLRAAATDPNCPFRHNRNLGRGFIDHLHGIAGRVREPDKTRLRRLFETQMRGGIKVCSKVRASDNFILRDGHVNCAATVISSRPLRECAREAGTLLKRVLQNPMGGHALEAARRSSSMAKILLPMAWAYFVDKRAYNLFSNELLLGVEIEQLSTSASYLFLDANYAPDSAPVGVHWAIDGREMNALRAFCQALAASMKKSGLGFVDLDPRIIDGDPAFFDDCHDAYHQLGGARMAFDPEHGVVCPELRVFGTSNLWAVGGAVFPTGSFANPTLLAMALAHRVSERLIREIVGAKVAAQ